MKSLYHHVIHRALCKSILLGWDQRIWIIHVSVTNFSYVRNGRDIVISERERERERESEREREKFCISLWHIDKHGVLQLFSLFWLLPGNHLYLGVVGMR